ncbi:OLC1v1009531C1 [Oldenlandia corymbosa var. corymbosa]|uniref:OLC1v1009531C1 n=1 Tax=Oldenlandia corymbosa var. corymbosa TaxID=529605 RepID=A0AAV1DQP2_OLDCO|nr:OLC1v1009531C1 [Oldenlandia corymbosa var. corymbosa]
MGCATSKPKVCQKCHESYSPVRRSYSLHAYHPPEKDGDSYHLVALTSSTLGSLKLDLLDHKNYHPIKEEKGDRGDEQQHRGGHHHHNLADVKLRKEEFAMGVVEAKSWSRMIDEKIPKIVPRTPVRTPPGEPETINAWELMEGLEDTSPLKPPPFHHIRSFSFHLGSDQMGHFTADDQPTPRVQENGESTTTLQKPIWLDLAENESNCNSNDTSIVSEFDPEVISTFRKALEELPPANPFHLKPLAGENGQALVGKGPALEAPEDHLVDVENKEVKGSAADTTRGKDRLIVYFTSLRGVRKTYEDCCSVRVILKGLGVKVDERDVSMHSGFKEELKELLGEGWPSSKGGLPKVFIGKKFLGGVDEIKKLNEDGQLEKVVEGCEAVDDGGGGGGGGVGNVVSPCQACGDVRFVPCETCSGSCKVYYEGDYDNDDDEQECEDAEFGFQRCPDCNENGLIRCPICCD